MYFYRYLALNWAAGIEHIRNRFGGNCYISDKWRNIYYMNICVSVFRSVDLYICERNHKIALHWQQDNPGIHHIYSHYTLIHNIQYWIRFFHLIYIVVVSTFSFTLWLIFKLACIWLCSRQNLESVCQMSIDTANNNIHTTVNITYLDVFEYIRSYVNLWAIGIYVWIYCLIARIYRYR